MVITSHLLIRVFAQSFQPIRKLKAQSMLKRSLPTFIGLIFAILATNSFAALPPKYLEVKEFQQCLSTQKIDTYEVWCMPAKKILSCPATSWKELKALAGIDKLPKCPSNSNLVPPLPADKPKNK
ncbi:MAG: hypothetical protein Q8R88_01085 [Desulfoprunum sp.]|nr:hypothetical protein [Desulfoprunum sp.]